MTWDGMIDKESFGPLPGLTLGDLLVSLVEVSLGSKLGPTLDDIFVPVVGTLVGTKL